MTAFTIISGDPEQTSTILSILDRHDVLPGNFKVMRPFEITDISGNTAHVDPGITLRFGPETDRAYFMREILPRIRDGSVEPVPRGTP